MKKSSIDYRRNRRKKWVLINTRNALAALVVANSTAQAQHIIYSLGISKQEKAIRIAQLAIETSSAVKKAFAYV